MYLSLFLLQSVEHKAAEEFAKLDPYGIGMTLVAMSVVFLSLLILYITFKNIAKLFVIDFAAKNPFQKKKNKLLSDKLKKEDTTLELGAAIAMAIQLYQNELHDHENTMLTIKKVNGNYSPWSSKIYGMRNELK